MTRSGTWDQLIQVIDTRENLSRPMLGLDNAVAPDTVPPPTSTWGAAVGDVPHAPNLGRDDLHVALLIAFIGGVAGGVFVLLGAWFSDVRAQHRAHQARILQLGSTVLACTRMVEDCVAEAQAKLAEYGDVTGRPAVALDNARLSAYELEFSRAETELRWITQGSRLLERLAALSKALIGLVMHWNAAPTACAPYFEAIDNAQRAFRAEVASFEQMSIRQRRKYLRRSIDKRREAEQRTAASK